MREYRSWLEKIIQLEAGRVTVSSCDLLPAEIKAFDEDGYAFADAMPQTIPLIEASAVLGARMIRFKISYDRQIERGILEDCLLPAPAYLLYIERVDESHSAWAVRNSLEYVLDRSYAVMDTILDYDGKMLLLNESSEKEPDGVKVLIFGLTSEQAEMIDAYGIDAVHEIIHDALQEDQPIMPLS